MKTENSVGQLSVSSSRVWVCGLALALLLSAPLVLRAQFDYVTNNGTIRISAYTGPGGVVVVPAATNGLPVTSIGNRAFGNRDTLLSVALPDSVTEIDMFAFCGCSQLTNASLGKGVATIGSLAFSQCPKLLDIALPDSVLSVGDHAFQDCDSLSQVSLGSGLTNLGPWAFLWSTRLTNITVDPRNITYSSVGGVLFNKDQTTLVMYPVGRTNSYTIPNTVRAIGPGAFFPARGLTNVILPVGLRDIGDSAFQLCLGLTSLVLPGSVTNIGQLAFGACSGLTSLVIPDSVIRIGDDAFGDCSGLTNLVIGTGVVTLGAGSFYYCVRLTTLKIPASVTFIGDGAFLRCVNLRSVYFQGYPPLRELDVFKYDILARGYYLPETTGLWGDWWDFSLSVWKPVITTSDASFGARTNQFGFPIRWDGSRVVVVEACTNLNGATWLPVSTNALTDGYSFFSEPQSTNAPCRFYRLRWP